MRDIERLIKRALPREVVDGFEPEQILPASNASTKRSRPKPSAGANDNSKRRRHGEDRRRTKPRSGQCGAQRSGTPGTIETRQSSRDERRELSSP